MASLSAKDRVSLCSFTFSVGPRCRNKTARTVAYLIQPLLQTIHISEQEYINAFDTDDWRKAIRNSVNGNHDYLFPRPDPQPQPAPSHPPPPPPPPPAPTP